jgi:phosphoribosylglycinamide formyltransferase-1
MFSKGFYLLTKNTFESCYFVSRFIDEFKQSRNFLGVLVVEDRPPESILQGRKLFHAEYASKKEWSDEMEKKWLGLYPPLNESSQRMIQLYGIPNFSVTHHPDTIFLGHDVNGKYAENCLKEICKETIPWLVTYLPKMLNAWWIEITKSRVLNCHSAVLPFARGMNSIENVAALKDIDAFQQAAGITIHYIDAGVDTGSIIRAERVADPFRFNSIWELKAHLYITGIEWYIQTVRDISGSADTTPAGIMPCPDLRGLNYRCKHFTAEKRRQAEEGYLWMKSQLKNDQGKHKMAGSMDSTDPI